MLYKEDRELTRGIPIRKLERPEDPLFYLVDKVGQLVFFGPTMMFRLPYEKSICHFVPASLRSSSGIDLAEAIFGTVDTEPAIKGRVYFEDAPWNGKGESPFLNGQEQRIIPKISSAPKPTSFQHYLTQPMVKKTNTGSEEPGADNKLTLHNWNQPESPQNKYKFLNSNGALEATGTGSAIRGHKRYWHKPETSPDKVRDVNARFIQNGQGVETLRNKKWKLDRQHTVICPVKEGTVFDGRVRFENLSDLELGALLSALQLPDSMRHHLGMGKPYGMGSARIETELHVTSRTGRYGRYEYLFANDGKFNLGELSDEENQNISQQAKSKFDCEMIKHDNSTGATNTAAQNSSLWKIPRLETLALMLEWDNAPNSQDTEYEPLSKWRNRRVLPTPHGVVRLAVLKQNGSRLNKQKKRNRPKDISKPKLKTDAKAGDRVKARLLEKKTRKGGWIAKHLESELQGPIHDTENVPGNAEAGQDVELTVASVNLKEMAFRWK